MIRAYLFALDPTDAQVEALRSHCGAQRFAYNWALARVKATLDQRAAERSYGIPDDQLTAPVNWSAYSLRRAWNQAKAEAAPWWAQNSKEAYSSGLANLATALTNWSASKTGKRAGRPVAFPQFKSRRARLSCRFTTGAFGLGADRRHIQLPRIGAVRTHEWQCGAVRAKLPLSERTYTCASCGLCLDRDLNAARNLAALASEHSWCRTVNQPDGNPRKTSPAGNGYCHGKTPPSAEPMPHREVRAS